MKQHFRKFLDAVPDRLHFAAHSHHYWPDVTFDAQAQAWLDAARLADAKWEHVFDVVVPAAQRQIARELSLPDATTIAFAPNTHEFVVRLLSCLPHGARVVTSGSEFHSFERQARRLEEDGTLRVERVASEPFATYGERLVASAHREKTELVFFSHVFFDSGSVVPDLAAVVNALPRDTLVVIDGYHGFLAVPTDLSSIASRAFYLAGGYKYAMSGEGACFLHVPNGSDLRPRDTGWFAAFGGLEERTGGPVAYGPGGMRFMGATFDPTALYRFNAAMQWRDRVGWTTERSLAHAHALQRRFTDRLAHAPHSPIRPEQLVVPVDDPHRGHFLAFRTAAAHELCATYTKVGIVTDARGDRLRFGFAVYHDENDVDALIARMLP